MKKNYIIFTALLFLFITACGSNQANSKGTNVVDHDKKMIRYVEKHKDQIFDYQWLPSGGLFVSGYDLGGTEDMYNVNGDVILHFLIIDKTNNQYKVTHYLEPSCCWSPTAIFFDEDWYNREYDLETNIHISYRSNFFWHQGDKGKEAIVIIYPNFEYIFEDDGCKCLTSYQESSFYRNDPHDSLDTEPMYIYSPDYNCGYPCWVFVIPEEDITENYELRFMEYTLNGSQLLSNSWENGPIAPIIESTHVVDPTVINGY